MCACVCKYVCVYVCECIHFALALPVPSCPTYIHTCADLYGHTFQDLAHLENELRVSREQLSAALQALNEALEAKNIFETQLKEALESKSVLHVQVQQSLQQQGERMLSGPHEDHASHRLVEDGEEVAQRSRDVETKVHGGSDSSSAQVSASQRQCANASPDLLNQNKVKTYRTQKEIQCRYIIVCSSIVST
jgi:ribosomal protein L16 Arg81 hydroxylase